jgi:arylsulfatase A-like enzyme
VLSLIKFSWVIFNIVNGALQLTFYEWFLLPITAVHQHILFIIPLGAIYSVILFFGTHQARWLSIASQGMLGIIQFLIVLLHMVSLRVELIIGLPPTYSMMSAGVSGGVGLLSLFAAEHLPFTLGGVAAGALAIVPLFWLHKRYPGWPAREKTQVAAVTVVSIVGLGWLTPRFFISADLLHAQNDPIIFFVAEFLHWSLDRDISQDRAPLSRGYQRELLYGDPADTGGRRLVTNLEQWRGHTKKNVVLVVLESLQHGHASFMGPVLVEGEERDTMPLLNSMRENMVVLENHYATHTTSMEELFSIGCSLYPSPSQPCITAINPRIPCNSFSEFLVSNGYVAGLFLSGSISFWNKDAFYSDRGFSVIHDMNNMPRRRGAFRNQWGIDERVTIRAMSDFVRQHRDESFFLQFITVLTHSPYHVVAPEFEVFSTEDTIDRYHNCLYYIDQSLGALFDTLREEELLEDTLVIVVADHGEAFQEHPGNIAHSRFLYEENVHVAAALYNPLLFHGSPSLQRVTSHVDLLPTVADLIGQPPDAVWQGTSMLEEGPSPLVYFYTEFGGSRLGLRDGDFKVIWNRDNNVVELFNLQTDPREENNLVNVLSERIPVYQDALAQWRSYHLSYIEDLGMTDLNPEGAVSLSSQEMPRQFESKSRYARRRNLSISAKTLKVNGVEYRSGIGIHANHWYSYDIGASKATRLVGRVGRDQRACAGKTQGFIFLDGQLAFSSGPLGRNTPAVGFDLDVSQAKTVTLASWYDRDGAAGDHLDWVETWLVQDAALAYRPGQAVRVADLRPSGATRRGRRLAVQEKPWPVPTGAEPRNLELPLGATVAYDLGVLGAHRLVGTIHPDDQSGAKAQTVTLFLDDEEVFQGAGELSQGPVELDIPLEPRHRVLKIKATAGSARGKVVFRDLRVETSPAAFAAARGRLRHRARGRKSWQLPLIPPAPPVPEGTDAGWHAPVKSRRTRQTPSLWLRAGHEIAYDFDGLDAARLTGQFSVVGSGRCVVVLSVQTSARLLWQSSQVRPRDRDVEVDVDIEGVGAVRLGGSGSGDCFVILDKLTVVTKAD